MNDETSPQTYQEDDTPTKPVGKPTGGWVMPEPVFRKSSGGSLPRRLGLDPEGQTAAAPAAIENSNVPNPAPSAASAPKQAAPAAAIAEQPDLSSELPPPEGEVAVAATKQQRSGLAKLLLIMLGLAGILLAVTVFLAVIYYLFFYRIGESQTF